MKYEDEQKRPDTAKQVLLTLVSRDYKPGQSLGQLTPASGRSVVGPKAPLAHRWCARMLGDRSFCRDHAIDPKSEMHRPSDVHALREDAAARLLNAGVAEESVATLFDPNRLHALLAGDPEFRALVYYNRITGTFMRYAIEDFNRAAAVVDGSNVAWNGRVRGRGGVPQLKYVDIVCRHLREYYGVADLRVYFDANILEDVRDGELMGELERHYQVVRTSVGTPADGAIIEASHELDCLLVSNDLYREYRKPSGTKAAARARASTGVSRRERKRALARRVGVVVRDGSPRFDPLVEELVARPEE